jgi:hypothetical protein
MGCNHAKAPGVEDRTIPGTGTNVLDTISWFIEKKIKIRMWHEG